MSSMKSEWHGDKLLKQIDGAVKKSLLTSALMVEADAVLNTPVDTGRLRGSITHKVDINSYSAKVGTNVEYAPHVEYGTRRQKAQPFLRPAIDENEQAIRNVFTTNLKKVLK